MRAATFLHPVYFAAKKISSIKTVIEEAICLSVEIMAALMDLDPIIRADPTVELLKETSYMLIHLKLYSTLS